MQRIATWMLVSLLLIGQPIAMLASDYFGQVTFNDVPVPGVTVTATYGDRKTIATTDQDGIFHLADLSDGKWDLTIEMLGFVPITRTINVPDDKEGQPSPLEVRSFDELARLAPPAAAPPVPTVSDISDDDPLFDRTGIGAADGLLINGSLNNGFSTPFALPRGVGNNRPRPPAGVKSYAAGLQLGNSSWDARPFSLTGAPADRPSYTDAHALATFGGPIRLPKLWNPVNLFVGYQGGSTTSATMQSTRVPTDLERAGDFSQTRNALGQVVRLIDPATGQSFAGNVIPPDRLTTQAASLLAYYPRADPHATGRFNYQAPVVAATRQDGLQSTVAYRTGRTQINGAASFQRTATTSTSIFGFEDARDALAFDAQVGWQLALSRAVTWRAQYRYSRTATESVPFFVGRLNVSGDAGIAGNDQSPLNWGPPSLTFASDLAGLTDGRYSSAVTRAHAWSGEFARFQGPHNLTAGGEIRTQTNVVAGQPDPRGSFGFTGTASGVDFADFLLGRPHTSSIAFGSPDERFDGASYAAFVTDDWRVRPSLTLTLGLRWEYETPVGEERGRLVNLDVTPGFTAVSPVLPGARGPLTGAAYGDALLSPDKRGLQPRLGVAWRPRVGSSLVVRAGYGLYRSTNVYVPIALLLAQQPPFVTTFNVASDPAHPLTLANGFGTNAAATAFNTFAVDPDLRVATAQNWQASVQRDVAAGFVVTATYLGAKGDHLMQQVLPNTFPAGARNPCPGCPVGFRYLTSGGRSIRHAAQLQARRRLSGGLTTTVEYTLAKAMDNAPAFGGASLDSRSLAQNWLDLEAEYARSNFDQRHLLTASAEYTTGVGVTGGALVDGWKGRLLKEWTFAGSLSAGSGLPLTPVYFAPIGGTGVIGSLRPDVTGISNDAPAGAYANAAAFAAPAAGLWGNAPRNAITGPATFSLNASIARTFRIGSRLNFDWRIDATNVLNHVTYAGVNTVMTSPEFGLPNRTNDMRKIRTTLRVRF